MQVNAAESAGDAARALDVMARNVFDADGRPFWHPERVEYIHQLACLGPLPAWVTSRWILAQAERSLRSRGVRRALDAVVELHGGTHRLPGRRAGADPRAWVLDRDWVFRQLLLFDLGGVGDFLGGEARRDLVDRADSPHDWAGATMGAYRLQERRPATLVWEEVGTGSVVEVPNLGSALLLLRGETVIGRIVPAGEGRMFESAPLQVPDRVAGRVAADPADWLAALRAERDASGACAVSTLRRSTTLLTDVPTPLWCAALFGDSGNPTAGRSWPDGVATEVLEAAHGARVDPRPEDDEVVDVWPCLAAALVQHDLLAALDGNLTAEGVDLVRWLGGVLPEPAAALCQRLAASTGQPGPPASETSAGGG